MDLRNRLERWIRSIPVWGFLALASLGVHVLLSETASHQLAALLLSLIAGVYLGFAVVDGRAEKILLQAIVAVLFMAFAAWSLNVNPLFLPLGYLAHAGWDWLHHLPKFDTKLPRWYIPACVVADLIVGLGLWVIWLW